jgi:hypothetical protein
MTPVYMPFTYLPESTARNLAALVGPVVVYQPMETGIADTLSTLASQGIIEIRIPLTGDETRLSAALAEFTQWAQMNPGKFTPGTDFFSSRQGEVPFFDESTVNRIRSDIKNYGKPDNTADGHEAGFSARLFLAVAQDNDMATDHLDHDLRHFKTLEQGLLDTFVDGDEADFDRHGLGTGIWREDPGARLTEQRIRAWATLAAADGRMPDLLITTSKAVTDTLMETWGASMVLERLASIRLAVPSVGETPPLSRVLHDAASRQSLTAEDLALFTALDRSAAAGPSDTITLFAALNRPPADMIGGMTPANIRPAEKRETDTAVRHTLILLVEK